MYNDLGDNAGRLVNTVSELLIFNMLVTACCLVHSFVAVYRRKYTTKRGETILRDESPLLFWGGVVAVWLIPISGWVFVVMLLVM